MSNKEVLPKITVSLYVKDGIDLTTIGESLLSIDKEYRHFVKYKFGGKKPYSDELLVLGGVREGSYIFDLMSFMMSGDGMMFATTFTTLTDFYLRMSETIEYLKNPFSRDKPYFDALMMEHMIAIMDMAAKPTSHVEISITGNNYAPIIVNTGEAKTIQANANQELEEILAPTSFPIDNQFVLFTQLTRNLTSKSGTKGIINEISPSQRDITFISPDVKKDILQLKESNPLLIGFMAEVEVVKVTGKPDRYNILKINGEVSAPQP